MELKHGYIQNTENIPAEHTGAGWIYFSEDDKAIYLDSGSGPVKFSGTEVDLSNYYTKDEVKNIIPSVEEYITQTEVEQLIDSTSPVFSNGLEKSNGTVSIKIDEDSEGYLSVTDKGLKTSGIHDTIDASFDRYLNTYGFTGQTVYLNESEWIKLKEDVESGNASWENNVIYMVYSDD